MNATGSQEPLEVGRRVRSSLDGTIVAIHGQQAPHTVGSIGGVMVTGGNATFDVIWDNGARSPKIPEALVRASTQWTLLPEVAGTEQIREAFVKAERYEQDARRKAEAEAAAYATARTLALAQYPHLRQAEPGQRADARLAAVNLRTELKRCFGGVKFSVRSDHNKVRIGWLDGPTVQQVDEVAMRFVIGRFDLDQDCMRTHPSAFTDLFGGTVYYDGVRERSDSLWQAGIDALWKRLQGDLEGRAKPPVDKLTQGYAGNVLDYGLLELVSVIVSSWDDRAKCYVPPPEARRHLAWLVWEDGQALCEPLCKQSTAEAAALSGSVAVT